MRLKKTEKAVAAAFEAEKSILHTCKVDCPVPKTTVVKVDYRNPRPKPTIGVEVNAVVNVTLVDVVSNPL